METPPKLAAREALNCVRDLAIGRLAIPMRFPLKKQQVRTVLNWTRRTMEQQFEAEDASRPRGNWIATSRAIRNHPLVGYGQPVKPANPRKGAYSRNEAWMDLVMSAAHHETDVRLQGVIVTIKRGQVAGSLTWWATRWNWTVKQVRGFKAQLRQHAMISVSEGQTPPSEKGTRRDRLSDVVTICNYEKYQTAAPPKGKGRGRPQPKKGQESNKRKNNSSPLPLSGQGERGRLVRDLVALEAPPSPSSEALEALVAYNAAAERHGWVPKTSLSPTEARRLETRLRQIGGAEAFSRAMQAVPGSRLDGDWSRRMRPDLTYVLSTGTANGDVLRALLDLADMAEAAPVDAPWWTDEAKRKLATVRMWREAIAATVTPGFWDFQNLGYTPDDPRCVIPSEVFDAVTIAHCERCGFTVPADKRLHLAAVDGRAVA